MNRKRRQPFEGIPVALFDSQLLQNLDVHRTAFEKLLAISSAWRSLLVQLTQNKPKYSKLKVILRKILKVEYPRRGGTNKVRPPYPRGGPVEERRATVFRQPGVDPRRRRRRLRAGPPGVRLVRHVRRNATPEPRADDAQVAAVHVRHVRRAVGDVQSGARRARSPAGRVHRELRRADREQ